MEKGEAARVALAIGVLTDWIARTDERLEKIEEEVSAVREGLDAWAGRIQELEAGKIVSPFTSDNE